MDKSKTNQKLNVAYKQPSALEQLGTFTANLIKDEIEGKVIVDGDSVLKLCITAVTRIAFDGKTDRLYQVLKVNYPEYFTT